MWYETGLYWLCWSTKPDRSDQNIMKKCSDPIADLSRTRILVSFLRCSHLKNNRPRVVRSDVSNSWCYISHQSSVIAKRASVCAKKQSLCKAAILGNNNINISIFISWRLSVTLLFSFYCKIRFMEVGWFQSSCHKSFVQIQAAKCATFKETQLGGESSSSASLPGDRSSKPWSTCPLKTYILRIKSTLRNISLSPGLGLDLLRI